MKTNQTKRNRWVIWICMYLIMLLVTACSSGGNSVPRKDAAASAFLYAHTASDVGGRANTDKAYVTREGDQARIHEQGACANSFFGQGTFPVAKNETRREICISEQNRLEAGERLGCSFDSIAVMMSAASTAASQTAPAFMTGPEGRLENIQLFLDTELADTMAVRKGLQALDKNSSHVTLDKIRDFKQAFISGRMGSDPTTNFIRTRARIKQPVAQLLANEDIRNVFIEKEMLGSLLNDMDALDREISGLYTTGARIVREDSAGRHRTAAIEEIAGRLEQLEQLRAAAVRMEGQYARFMTLVGFEETSTAQNQVLVAAWNSVLWETMAVSFGPEGCGQYDFQSDVRQPLERLAAHCCMAGDAARALRALESFDNPAGQDITLRPILHSPLDDWRRWEQRANEIKRRI